MSSKRKRRIPQCARCRSHNVSATVRGHKRECQWKDCTCSKCLMVTEKRRVTAVRVAVLRRERKQRMTHRMGLDAFHVGLHGASPWGMMGRMPGPYAEPLQDSHYNGMLHMNYRGMYPHYENAYHHLYPRDLVAYHDDEPQDDSGITHSLESFQHEYDSLMRKLNDGQFSPGNKTEISSPHKSSPGPHRVFFRPTSPHGPVDVYRSPVTHGDICQPRLPYDNHRYLPMMLNSPRTLACPCPKSTEFPFGVCM